MHTHSLPGRRLLALAAISGLLAACSSLPTQHDAKIQAAWVVLGENGQAIARAVTTDNICPSLVQDGNLVAMNHRAGPSTLPLRKTASKPEDSKPSDFPVLTCEAPLLPATRTASVGGRDLPIPKPVAQKIIVIGDTGCRLKVADNYFQSCNDSEKWAFREMVETAARFKPDLVVHVGDYHYRENACPEGNKECAGSPWGYGWDTWQADFFSPATALLKAAPWVVVRGNHETCVRAGQGWWRLMDPRPLKRGRDCVDESDDLRGDYSDPYAVPLGRVGSEQAQLIIFDSAKVPIKPLAKTDAAYQLYMEQFKAVNKLAESADFNIFIDHHPVLAFAAERKKDGPLNIFPGNLAMQDIMQTLNTTRLFPSKVQATLAGHVHLFETLTFSTDHPVQFVAGNGGSSLDTPLPTPLAANSTPYTEAKLDYFSNSNEVGFMTMEREQQSWKIQAWNKQGKLITECRTQGKKTDCKNM
ncbi:metallophosphoesterase [Undibacterium pigrum]|uniref:3',5'-cyclic AMP phosphodiesterase CpdA n=1 Tax=Undibacterium pigrum TaxID=401470 RepID=A0A318JCE0_9BURK|nr:metallophosphoesterase [Undibacterium pigrum]PXX45256.1 3',5'-cyclic AMP phosphodiesterase CpdA [Undibacterium pigrum]